MNLLTIFWAELKREIILTFRYPFELMGRLVWNLGFALMIFYGFGAVGGANSSAIPGFESGQTGRLVGLLITYIAINAINNASEMLLEETQTGTLEQAALSPPPLVLILLMRDMASYIEMLIRFALVLGVAVLITGVKLYLDIPTLCLLLTLMYLGLEGVGMMLGAAALLYKRIATLAQFAVMLVFGLAIIPLETLPKWMGVFTENFPFTKALIIIRQSIVEGVPFSDLFANGSLISLVVNTVIFLTLGILAFFAAERKARQWGTLNQY